MAGILTCRTSTEEAAPPNGGCRRLILRRIRCAFHGQLSRSDRLTPPVLQLCEDDGPGLAMLFHRRLVDKSGVSQPQVRAGSAWREFDGHHGLGAFRAAGVSHPGQLDQSILLEPKKTSVMGMPLSLEMSFP